MHKFAIPFVSSFSELARVLGELPNQIIGQPYAICEVGEPYEEFLSSGLSRPDDIKAVEEHVVKVMCRDLDHYLRTREGRIYWRVPFEHEIVDYSVVVRYDENGPDKDYITDRPCVMDKNWKMVKCYARLFRARHKTDAPINKKEAA